MKTLQVLPKPLPDHLSRIYPSLTRHGYVLTYGRKVEQESSVRQAGACVGIVKHAIDGDKTMALDKNRMSSDALDTHGENGVSLETCGITWGVDIDLGF